MNTSFVGEVIEASPKAWSYFKDFFTNDFPGAQGVEHFESLDFHFQLGVFIRFFDQINGDIQLYSTDSEALKEAVKDAFATYEEYLFLDS